MQNLLIFISKIYVSLQAQCMMIMNLGYSQKNFLRGAVWMDMTLEQVLMRSMKTQGGLTHGRGLSVF